MSDVKLEDLAAAQKIVESHLPIMMDHVIAPDEGKRNVYYLEIIAKWNPSTAKIEDQGTGSLTGPLNSSTSAERKRLYKQFPLWTTLKARLEQPSDPANVIVIAKVHNTNNEVAIAFVFGVKTGA